MAVASISAQQQVFLATLLGVPLDRQKKINDNNLINP